MAENNLFSFATKELSQDAIIAWLINKSCVNETDKTGKNFLCNLMGWETSEKFEITNVIRQYKSIDVFVEIKKDDGKEAIIIEDKTDTFLHDFQMLKYIGKIAEEKGKIKYNKIHFVLVKTGDIPKIEQVKFDFEKTILNNIESKQNKEIFQEIENKFEVEIKGEYKIKVSNEKLADKTLNSIRNYLKKDGTICVVDSIVNGEEYKEYIKNSKSKDDYILNYYWSFLVNDNSKHLCDNYNIRYNEVCEFLDSKKDKVVNYHFSKPNVGGGKRGYECCIICNDCLKYQKSVESAESVKENYCVLPIVTFDDEKIVFQVNYTLIADLEKVHGYVPFKDIPHSNLKTKYEEYREDLKKSMKTSEYNDVLSIRGKHCIVKWTWQYGEQISEEQINRMLSCAEYIKNSIESDNK